MGKNLYSRTLKKSTFSNGNGGISTGTYNNYLFYITIIKSILNPLILKINFKYFYLNFIIII